MAYFPLLQHLTVERYGLYPGGDGTGRFDVDFREGLTLILGANGLGKTTLMTLLFRLLAGTYDIPLPEGEVGNANLEPQKLSQRLRRQFAARVNDGAQEASARLNFAVGGRQFQLERRLADLELTGIWVDGQGRGRTEEDYHTAVVEAAGLASFGDWLLILRTLVFFFEDRRALVWDPGAQRQLLRALLLTPARAREWTMQEREILQLDSRMRNLQAALNRELRERLTTIQQLDSAPAVRSALLAAERTLSTLNDRHTELSEGIEGAEETRNSARLNAMRAQAAHDQALRELERARLMAIDAKLPGAEDSLRFLLARLMSDDTCLACGTEGVAAKRAALQATIEAHHCIVCDASLPTPSADVVDIGDERLQALKTKVDVLAIQASEQANLRDEASSAYDRDSEALAQCAVERDDAHDKVVALMNQLPPEERRVTAQQQKLDALKELVDDLKAQIAVERAKFAGSLNQYREDIQQFADTIKHAFADAARGFLFEESSLSWVPKRTQVGQAGAAGLDPVEYPAFAVELTGSDFVGVQRRDSPNQVSESQREFIDLAFRMALIAVASPERASTLAIDAPESSLDAVFVDRAADVLARFARAGQGVVNRLVITSNLGAGPLVPHLLREVAPAGQRMDRVVDLFYAGVPTRAMLYSKAAYDAYWKELRAQIDEPDEPGTASDGT